MAYEVLGYDYSGMVASARAGMQAMGYGAWVCAAAIAAVAIKKAWSSGWRSAVEPAVNAGVYAIAKLMAWAGAAMIGAGTVWQCWESRAWTMPDQAWSWIVLFAGVDYGSYWWHRLRHKSALWWASHESHHSSPELDLTTSIRITDAMNFFGAFLFMCPWALLGFHPMAIGACATFGRLWAVWTHANGWIGPSRFDRWVVSDAVHRIHHAKNIECLDMNFGDVFSVWDRLHGTYLDPMAAPQSLEFGCLGTRPGANPLRAAFRAFADLARHARAQPGWLSKAKAIVYAPGWSAARADLDTVAGLRRAWLDKAGNVETPAASIEKFEAGRSVEENSAA